MHVDHLKMMSDDPRDILDQYWKVFRDFKNFRNFIIFLTSGAIFEQRFPLARAHRGANPLACASANIKSRPEKSEKWLLMA